MTSMDILNYVKKEMESSSPSNKEMKRSERIADKLCNQLFKEKGERGKIFSIR